MDNSKIFSKIHETYKESFQFLQIFGTFGMKQFTRDRKLVTIFAILWIIVYPLISFIFGFTSIRNFGQFVELTTMFIGFFLMWWFDLSTLLSIEEKLWKSLSCSRNSRNLMKMKLLKRRNFLWTECKTFGLLALFWPQSFIVSSRAFLTTKMYFLAWFNFWTKTSR